MNIITRLAAPSDAAIIIEFNMLMAKETENLELISNVYKKARRIYSQIHQKVYIILRRQTARLSDK